MNKKMSFEAALTRLNEIVEQLEGGGEQLEASLKLFEEGSALTTFCYEKLEKAEQKIQTIAELEKPAGEEQDGE